MSRAARLEIITKLEELRGSRVLAYCTSDRFGLSAQIAEDVLRPMYKHLLSMAGDDKLEKLDLFLYSRGGAGAVPWPLVCMAREFCDELAVLIPFRAHSAATMVGIGADKIVMGRKAELGPIDPSLQQFSPTPQPTPQSVGVEDVSAYLDFIKHRVGIDDQAVLGHLTAQLARQVQPLTVGTIQREYLNIRIVAEKLLKTRKEELEPEKVQELVRTLTQEIYSHGHAIGRREAKELGLPVIYAPADVESAMWNLYEQYESLMQLTTPCDWQAALDAANTEETDLPDLPIAVLESQAHFHSCETNARLRKRRQWPTALQLNFNPNIPINMTVQANAGGQVQVNQQQINNALTQIQQELARRAASLIRDEVAAQAPSVGVDIQMSAARWVER
jgi:hypothetical protein